VVLIVRKIIALLCLSLFLLTQAPAAWAEGPSVSARACVLMAPDGRILYEKNANERLPVASTTKIMTALVVLEEAGLSDTVTIPEECCRLEGSSMYLKAGETYTVEQLLYGLMLVSGNDAALALALHVADSEEAFVRRMNEKCRELGMENSHFLNPHGLPEKGHESTAHDMALLMNAAMKNEAFARLTAAKSYCLGEQTLLNHNKLLYLCSGCTGGKTGFTREAGRCLVSACCREGLDLFCVTLSAPDDWNDHSRLYDWAYGQYRLADLNAQLEVDLPLVSGKAGNVALRAEPASVLVRKDEELQVKLFLPRFLFAPVEAGEVLGSYRVYTENCCVAEGALLAAEAVDE